MKETRKRLGKLYAEGKSPYYAQHYEEFKEEIDAELSDKDETKSKKRK